MLYEDLLYVVMGMKAGLYCLVPLNCILLLERDHALTLVPAHIFASSVMEPPHCSASLPKTN